MLRRLHNHIFACKLKEVFESPLVLVYQTLGNVDNLGLKQQLRAGLEKEPSVKDAQFSVCMMKNTIAAAAGDETLSKLFTNSNLLVGFKLPEQQQQLLQQQQQTQGDPQQQQQYQGLLAAAMQKVRQDMSPQEAIGGLLQQQQQPGPHIPQPALKAFVETGVKLPSEQPLVLVGAFYKCAATPMARLKKWVKLDPRQVYGELLGTLDAPVNELLAIEACAEDLLACFDEAGGPDVAEILEYKAAAGDAQQQPPTV